MQTAAKIRAWTQKMEMCQFSNVLSRSRNAEQRSHVEFIQLRDFLLRIFILLLLMLMLSLLIFCIPTKLTRFSCCYVCSLRFKFILSRTLVILLNGVLAFLIFGVKF